MIKKEDILQTTDGGKNVILEYYPQSSVGFQSRRNFKLRPDDKNASACVFQKDGIWFIQDKGGSDTQAYTAITLVMSKDNLSFPAALEKIASKYAPHLLDKGGKDLSFDPKPAMTVVDGIDEIEIVYRTPPIFTEKELLCLGWKITQEHCESLLLKPVEYYITKANDKGKSYKMQPTEDYPIFAYDYGSWGKIYQPAGKLRFMSYGVKPADFIFGDKTVLAAIKDAKDNKKFLDNIQSADDFEDERWDELVICSGGSDALNVRAAGYHVCWLNSETADLKDSDYYVLKRLAKQIYICYDIDDTGLRNTFRLALKNIDLNIILLPEDLKNVSSGKPGKYCKDVKDLMLKYRKSNQQNPHKFFDSLIKLAFSLKFWVEKKDKNGNFTGYDINNEQLYHFLNASGFWKIPTTSNKKGYTFCFVKNNIVELIDEEAVSSKCSAYLIEYLRDHSEYYSQILVNAIHRSNQIKLGSLDKLRIIEPDFEAWSKTSDHFFFRNAIARVTAIDISNIKPSDCNYFVYKHKIIDFDFSPLKPFFEIKESDIYINLKNKLAAISTPHTPIYNNIKKEIDALRDIDKYEVSFSSWECSFMKYIFNTGRLYWRKEELGLPLSEDEKKEVNLHFINKVVALGYMLYKYKDPGQAYGIYAMEIEQSEEGTHLGGTGKSLYMSSIEQLRNQLFINGQDLRQDNAEFLFGGVQKGITDHVFFDDLNEFVDLHRFMPMITGKMTVNAKYQSQFLLDYKDAPRVGFTSNHAMKKFDSSLRRRTWFTAFSDFYHPEDPDRGLRERSPFTEFKKNLITDYTKEEMNMFYNFMMQCLQSFLKFRVRIQPPMQQLEKRMLQRALTDEFIYWAEDYFNEARLNTLINKHKAFEDYKITLNKKIADSIKVTTFKIKINQYCQYKGYVFNPEELLTSETEKARNEIRRKEDGQDVYYFFIATPEYIPTEMLDNSKDEPPF